MRNTFFIAGLVCMIFISCLYNSADDISHIPSRPAESTFVVDSDGVLPVEVQALLNDKINSLYACTGIEVYIYIKNSLSGYNPQNFINQVKDTWGLDEHSKHALLLLSASDGKACIVSNTLDMKDENNQISLNTGMYKKQQGFENAVKYAFNTAVGRICATYGITDQYSFDDLKPLKQNKLLPCLIGISLIILIISLALFFNTSLVQNDNSSSNAKYALNSTHYVLTLKNYLIKNLLITLNIALFMVLYGIYMYKAGKLQTLFIFSPFFILMIFPFFKDTIFVIWDLNNSKNVKVEGRVTGVFRTYFRYYFVISDLLGNNTLISSNNPILSENNYISAICTKKIKHITQMDMLYERILF